MKEAYSNSVAFSKEELQQARRVGREEIEEMKEMEEDSVGPKAFHPSFDDDQLM